VTKKTEKELQREKIAQDIKTYLARGGVVKTYSYGESVVDPLTEGWGLNPKIIRNKKA
jgi:hypothetical protein